MGAKFCDEKTRDLEAAYSKDCVILACTVLTQCQGMSDGQMDGRLDDG